MSITNERIIEALQHEAATLKAQVHQLERERDTAMLRSNERYTQLRAAERERDVALARVKEFQAKLDISNPGSYVEDLQLRVRQLESEKAEHYEHARTATESALKTCIRARERQASQIARLSAELSAAETALASARELLDHAEMVIECAEPHVQGVSVAGDIDDWKQCYGTWLTSHPSPVPVAAPCAGCKTLRSDYQRAAEQVVEQRATLTRVKQLLLMGCHQSALEALE